MTSNTTPASDSKKDTDRPASDDSDSETEDVFHDARFPAEEEAVSCLPPPCHIRQVFTDNRHAYENRNDSAF